MGYNCVKKASSHFLVSRTSATGKTQLTSYFSSVTCHVLSSSGLRPLSIDYCHDLYTRAWVCIRVVFLNTHFIYSSDYGRGAVRAENTHSHTSGQSQNTEWHLQMHNHTQVVLENAYEDRKNVTISQKRRRKSRHVKGEGGMPAFNTTVCATR